MLAKSQYGYKQQFQNIDNIQRITAIINQCITSEVAIHISVPSSSELFSCKILDVDSDAKSVMLTELTPKYGQKHLENADSIQVFTQINGAEVSFESSLKNVKNPLFKTRNCITQPSNIKYCQRRRAHRVHISLSLDVSASLLFEQSEILKGQLRDISSDGMRIQFRKVPPKIFDELETVSNCKIELPDHTRIKCQFEVRHLNRHQRNRGCDIGGLFVELDQLQKRSIEKFIAGIERKSLRYSR